MIIKHTFLVGGTGADAIGVSASGLVYLMRNVVS